MEILETHKMPKNANKLFCSECNFKCSKYSNYAKHLTTDKHIRNTNGTKKMPKNATPFMCLCNKTYTTKSGLWKHKQKCKLLKSECNENTQDHNSHDDFVIDKELVVNIMKQNHELQNQVMELLKNGTQQITNNNNNKTFNLQFFLNDTCKNAMNIMDFVNNLQLQLDDLEKMGEVGYVNGMSNIIIKNLKDMDVTERPVHCTDAKREVLYVKDEDKWDKETSDKPKIRKAIKHVAHKNARLLQEFKEKHPDCTKSESKHSDTYTKLMVEAMGGKGSNDDEQESKIIKKVSKEITLAEVNP